MYETQGGAGLRLGFRVDGLPEISLAEQSSSPIPLCSLAIAQGALHRDFFWLHPGTGVKLDSKMTVPWRRLWIGRRPPRRRTRGILATVPARLIGALRLQAPCQADFTPQGQGKQNQ